MKVKKIKKSTSKLTIKTNLCFLIKDNKVLLAYKKRGFGVSRWNGIGGKVNKKETVKNALLREVREEICVTLKKFEKVGDICFYFQNNPEWNQQMTVFLCTEWEGKPSESEEMRPKWFSMDKIPFKKMWPDDIYWLLDVLKGKKVTAEFLFDENEEIIDFWIE